jgi:hypothetical protein
VGFCFNKPLNFYIEPLNLFSENGSVSARKLSLTLNIMPNASTQTDMPTETQTDAQHTRRPLKDITKKKYEQAVKRLTDADLTLNNTREVFEWFKEKELGDSAVKTYLSALKYHFSVENTEFPTPYQREIDRLYGRQNDRDEEQKLSEKQVQNFATYPQLMEVQKYYADLPDKTENQWKKYVLASLYTLNAPVRADYGDMKVYGRRDARRTTGNELIWTDKPAFIFREYKTKDTYGTVTIPVSKELRVVIADWFKHLGSTPKYLLGSVVAPNHLSTQLADAFSRTGKFVGVNLLRHAYIQHHLPAIATNTAKRAELAGRMLHSVERQQAYYSQNV